MTRRNLYSFERKYTLAQEAGNDYSHWLWSKLLILCLSPFLQPVPSCCTHWFSLCLFTFIIYFDFLLLHLQVAILLCSK